MSYNNIPEPRLDPPEPISVGKCKYCGEDIYKGDDIAELNGDTYHLDCFTDCAASILTEQFGAKVSVAEKPDGYDG